MTITSVTSGHTSSGFTVTNGNELLVLSGGTASATIVQNGGLLVVSGTDSGATISAGGSETISKGSASGDLIYGTATDSASVANETVENGGTLFMFGSATSTTVLSGGTLNISGNNTATNTVVSGGGTVVLASGKATLAGSLTFEGGSNTLDVTAAVTSSGAHDAATISGFSNTDKIDVTALGVGGTLSFTTSTISGTTDEVATYNGDSFIFSGTTTYTSTTLDVVTSGGREYIEYNSGGWPSGAISTLSAGSYTGLTVTSSETLIVPAGASVVSTTVQNGGALVISGGSDTSATISSGGTETVSAGSATSDKIFGTVLTVSGGTGVFANETVENGGTFDLYNGNSAASTTVLSGGLFLLSGNNGAVTNTVLSGGGTLELDSPKANISGSLTFAGGGNTLDVAVVASSGFGDLASISGFSSTDEIDVSVLGTGATLSFSTSGGNEDVTAIAGSNSETFIFAGTSTYTTSTLAVVSAGGHEYIEYNAGGFTGITTSVTTSTASGVYTETAGNTLLVLSGGSVTAPTIQNGAFLVVNGGVDSSANILSGGLETISSGSASGDQIYGSAIVSGGSVTNETVQNGGTLTIDPGLASNTVLNGGATLDLTGASATLSGSLTFANGDNSLVVSAISSAGAGDQAVISGFSTNDKIEVTGISSSGAHLTFGSGPGGEEIATISGTGGGSESFIFANGTTYNAGTMSLAPDGTGVDLVLDTTPVVTFTSLNGLTTNTATQTVNGTVNVSVDPYAIGTTVSVIENGQTVGQGVVGSNGYWSAQVTFLNDDGANVLSATDTDKAGNTGSTSQSLTYNVNTAAAAFTAGNLVISISGDGDGSGVYGDNQASPMTLEQITTSGSIVSQIVMPETTTVVNGVTEYAISSEYGSSSEGTLELSADGHSLVIAGYGINPQTYNEGGAAVYGNAAEAQSTSIPGGQYTAVPRVIADINADGTIDTSTALFNVFNTNNPRSVATVNGSSFYISGQGAKGDTTGGVFYTTDGASSATAVDDTTTTRTAEIYNGSLYVSADNKGGLTGIVDYGPLASLSSPTVVIPGTVTLTASNGNTVNGSDAGSAVNLSPENFFFANSTTLYVADGGDPKNGGIGDGGLQKWTFNGTQWTLDYTLSAGLNLVANTSASGTSGLIGLTGEVVGNSVELFATNETLTDLDQTYVYEISDQLDATTPAPDESFAAILTASPDENIRGISFAPTESTPCYCPGTLILTERGEVPVETLAIGDKLMTKAAILRPIKWIGRRSYGGRFVMGRTDILPICIKAGALDDNAPRRDLWVSPHHAIYLEGVLIEAKDLVNGVSIVQAEKVERVEYFHVELETHDVIMAEGALAESFIDDDSRGMFHNAHEYAALYPNAASGRAQYCAPRLSDGYEVETARRHIAKRAGLRPADAAPAVGALRGFIDAIGPRRIIGWAQNIDHPEAPVCLDIYAGPMLIGQVVANRYREGLKRNAFGSGNHEFKFVVPAGFVFDPASIEVRRSLDGAPLDPSHACAAKVAAIAAA
jgi:autotransporter passenger strand-loop-strand repeat protein